MKVKVTFNKAVKKAVAVSCSAILMLSCVTPSYAATGIIPKTEEDLSSVLTFSSDGTDLSLFSETSGDVTNVTSNDDGEIVLGAQYKLSSGNYYAQSYTKALSQSADGKTAAIAFKIKADSENSADKLFITTGSGSSYKSTTEVFALDAKGNIGIPIKSGSTDTTGWPDNIGTSTMKTTYTKGVWQDVAIAIDKKNAKVTAYVDGVNLGTAFVGKPDSVKSGDFHFMFHVEGGQTAKFYIDDVKYIKDASKLVAAADKNTIEKGATVTVDFSSLIENKDLVSQVKVYESLSGTEVGASASFSGEKLNVTLTGATVDGTEYRIELPNFKDVMGNELYNNSLYVSTGLPAGAVRNVELRNDNFTNYTIDSSAHYSAPAGWTKSYQWMAFESTDLKPQTDADTERSTAVLIKKDASSKTGNELWGSGGMYLPLPSKVNSGKLTINYDIKPIKYIRGGANLSKDSLWETQFAFGVYADLPGANVMATDDSCFAALQAIKKTQFGFALDRINTGSYDNWQNVSVGSRWHNYEELDTDGSPWDMKETVTIATPKWYNVSVELDFDKETVTYYVDGNKVTESDSIMSKVGTVSSGTVTNPIKNGVVGIGFGFGTYPTYTEQLVDNIKVTRTLGELGDAVVDFTEDFNTYGDSGNGDVELKNGCSVGNVLTPKGWSQGWLWTDNDASGNSDNVLTRPVDVSADSRGKAVKIGKTNTGTNGWDTPYIYHSLNREYANGVVEFEYEFNPHMAATADKGSITSSGFTPTAVDKAKPFQVGLFANKWDFVGRYQTQEEGNTGAVGTSNMVKPANDRVILGIEGTQLNAYSKDGNTPTKIADITNNQWYKIKHTINLDFGTIKTYLYDNNEWVLKAETTMPNMNIAQLGGIGFLCAENTLNSETYIDNVKVTYQGEKVKGGISAVRFYDCMGEMYGISPTLTTLTEKVAVSFWSKPDASSVNTTTVKLRKGATPVEYTGQMDENGVYVMTLADLLDKNTDYTLAIDGVTVGGTSLPEFELNVKSEENGVRIIEPITISVNDTKAIEGAIAENDVVTASTYIIDTTGTIHPYNFSMALYYGDMLNSFDFVDFSMGGENSKRKKAECTFTATADDTANLTKMKAFLWGGSDKLTPFMPSVEFSVTK